MKSKFVKNAKNKLQSIARMKIFSSVAPVITIGIIYRVKVLSEVEGLMLMLKILHKLQIEKVNSQSM